ncbi:hypothetical protein CTM67_19145 [Photobacterium phosphoreum]|nr:hypothetical protein CTM67_19145 [Photobacterium phosphoreum]
MHTDALFQILEAHFLNVDIIIPPKDNKFADECHQPKRMNNLVAYMVWMSSNGKSSNIMVGRMYRKWRCNVIKG